MIRYKYIKENNCKSKYLFNQGDKVYIYLSSSVKYFP